jgi:dephospho-CoA kinase
VEKILLITCKKEIQLLRVQNRDSVSLESAKNIISKQMSLDEKEKKSDFLIENSGTKEELYEEIEKFLIKIS